MRRCSYCLEQMKRVPNSTYFYHVFIHPNKHQHNMSLISPYLVCDHYAIKENTYAATL